jgi:hypothetical protein
MKYTLEDYKQGRCALNDIDTEIPDAAPIAPPQETIDDYLAVHAELGGKQFLLEWAKANPAKFYDQLLKILEKMDTIKRAGEQSTKLEELNAKDLESLSSTEIKRLLLQKP